MRLKEIVDKALKEQNRSLSWLAVEMDKTFDGLKLSLIKGSIKYTDLRRMAEILKVPASSFFQEDSFSVAAEDRVEYGSLKSELRMCKQLADTLKGQLADKEKIINLLTKSS